MTNRAEPHEKPNLTTRFGRLVERLSYLNLLVLAGCTICASTLLVFFLTPFGNGISNECKLSVATFADSLYLSIVTFTTLGYGDITPVGFAKVIECVNVSIGMALIAIFIGRVASERQAATLLLLASSDMERRLMDFANSVKDLTRDVAVEPPEGRVERVRVATKLLSAMIEAVKNYVFFNANQAPQAFVNAGSAVSALSASMIDAHAAVIETYKSGTMTVGVERRLDSIARRLEGLAASMCLIDVSRQERVVRVSNQMAGTREKLVTWLKSHVTAITLANVLGECLRGPIAAWPKGHHKEIAQRLGLSNSLVQKCIAIHIGTNALPRK